MYYNKRFIGYIQIIYFLVVYLNKKTIAKKKKKKIVIQNIHVQTSSV